MATKAHTPTPWELTYFSKPDGNSIETVQDVADTVAYSALRGDRAELHGVTIPDCDNGDPVPVICYTGNGPKSAANAAFIFQACNSFEQMRDALEAAADYLSRLPQLPDRGCDVKKVTESCRAALAAAKVKT